MSGEIVGMPRRFTDQLHGISDPLANDILFAGVFQTHEQVFYAALLLDGDFVRKDVYPRINLHSVRVDDPCTPVPAIPTELLLLCQRKSQLDSQL